MVHGLAAQSGGAMRINSRLGEGTTVELWLPISEHASTDGERRVAEPVRPGFSCRVLLVDDDPLILAATAEMLEDLGHVVVEAASGQRALDLLQRGTRVDLVITDHAMPGMTGTELARAVRTAWPALPIILASGYADLPNGEDPGLPRLSKPYQQDELASQIARAFEPAAPTNVIPIEVRRPA
jgi:CheY-like chemotaxis protein